MKHRSFALFLSLLLLLSIPVSGLADLKRGSRGDEVETLQQMLIEMGFLNDKADGIFGKKTEAAVKLLQEYWGVNTTGRLDDDDLFAVYDLYYIATGQMEDDGQDEEELKEMYPAYCSWHGTQAPWEANFCYRHLEEKLLYDKYAYPNPPAKLKALLIEQLCRVWEEDILFMYDEWEENAPDDDETAFEQRDQFLETLETFDPGEEKLAWLEAQGVDLCFTLHGAEPQPLS